MPSQMKLSLPVQDLLRCPICKAKLERLNEEFLCANSQCSAYFPIIDGIPVLINENTSVFSIDDFVSRKNTTLNLRTESGIKKILRQVVPSIGGKAVSKNIKGKRNYEKLANLLAGQSKAPKVLVVGGSIAGHGMESLLASPSIEFVESDVSFGPRTTLICDAHDIPFEDGSFDAVIVQAVLEHVVDPYRCVEEIHRVLNDRGLVYAETPFMSQVHMGRYDFTRFTHLGHRRLFRKFEEIDSGPVCGPGMALAWSYQYFLMSFTKSKVLRKLILAFANLTSFYLKYFDYYLIDKAGAFDSAFGFYFLGKKSDRILSDRELLTLYRGAL